MTTNLSKTIGNGFGHAYKLSKGKSFGHVYIDPAKLRMNRLSAKDKAGNSVMDNVADNSLIDLLTKVLTQKLSTHKKQKIFSKI